MVSAVFHDPQAMRAAARRAAAEVSQPVGPSASTTAGLEAGGGPAPDAVRIPARSFSAAANDDDASTSTQPWRRLRPALDLRALARTALPTVAGVALLVLVWAALTGKGGTFPTPRATFDEAVRLFSDPFYRKGPNDQGIGWNVLFSLQRVAEGFGLAALVGIPAGFLIGRFAFLDRMFAPLISLLRPVSPLAWLPIGLLVFKAANPAAIWTLFICSIWPMVINTAVGVKSVPADYLNVARVLRLSEWKVTTRILLPAVLPYMVTGVRLSVSTAWLVIVAAEMLTGGVGIGFWVWDEWNNLNVTHILVAIFVIGGVGLVLEQALVALARRVTYAA
jgi:nitrate/nitrite transport system permease protein